MIYDYIYELISTLFINPLSLGVYGAIFFEFFTLYLCFEIFRVMLYPLMFLLRLIIAIGKGFSGKPQKIRARSFWKDNE